MKQGEKADWNLNALVAESRASWPRSAQGIPCGAVCIIDLACVLFSLNSAPFRRPERLWLRVGNTLCIFRWAFGKHKAWLQRSDLSLKKKKML